MYIFWEITAIVNTPISKSWWIYMFLAPLNIVTCIPIAMQRVDKHIPETNALNNRTSVAG
jgi:hypothetical protein